MSGQTRPARPARDAGRSGAGGAAKTGGQASVAEISGAAETSGAAEITETPAVAGGAAVTAGPADRGGTSGMVRPGRPGSALGHPLRVALLELLARRATLTATEAARELGESSGACSFHLRQLERYGHVQEAPAPRGRVRPWRLAAGAAPLAPADEFGDLARELENEGYRRWLAGRQTAPPGWRDEAFSAVVYLTPDELTEVAAAIRSVIASFAGRADPGLDPPAAGSGRAAGSGPVMPVGVVARMFPLLPASSDG